MRDLNIQTTEIITLKFETQTLITTLKNGACKDDRLALCVCEGVFNVNSELEHWWKEVDTGSGTGAGTPIMSRTQL